MSRDVYGAVEVFNKKTNLWDFLKIKFFSEGNESAGVDFYLGSSSIAAALTGEDCFDFSEGEEDEYAPSKKQRNLNEIESWFDKRLRSSAMKLREDLSQEVRDMLTKDESDSYSYTPTNITFTYADLQLLKRLAKLASKRAKNFYKYNFSKVENILEFIYRNYNDMSFMGTGDQLRMTVYVV